MGDLTTAAIGACASWITSACLASVLGIDQQAILWAFFGACIGLSIAPGASFGKAIAAFVFVILACALGGTIASHQWHKDDPLWRNGYACMLAIGFHPIVSHAINKAQAIMNGWATKAGARNE